MYPLYGLGIKDISNLTLCCMDRPDMTSTVCCGCKASNQTKQAKLGCMALAGINANLIICMEGMGAK